MSLIAELKRRNVFRVGVAYAIVGVACCMEVASVTALPARYICQDWALTLRWLRFFVDCWVFPLALVIVAWAFEMTPEGLKREAEVDRTESTNHVTGRKLDFAIIGLLLAAVVFLVFEAYILESGPEPVPLPVEPVSVPVEPDLDGEPTAREKSIAVLPFANRSANQEDAFFVDGIHDDVLTHISRISALKVISPNLRHELSRHNEESEDDR